jgi:BlaI family penicillinase repressor
MEDYKMENRPEISESELEIMKVLWAKGLPMSVQDICDEMINKEWKYSTVATLLGRMAKKGAIEGRKKGYVYYYTTLLNEKEYKISQAKKFVGKLYDGSVKNLVVTLFENKELSDEEVAELKNLFNLK